MAVTSRAVIGHSGTSLAVRTEDANGAPTNITGVSVGSVQLLHVNAVGGTFTLTLNGQTVTVPYGAPPSNTDGTSGTGTVQALLETIVGAGNVTVTGWNPYKIAFAATQPTLTVNTSNLLATRAADPATAGSTADATHDITSKRGNWALSFAGGGYYGAHFETVAAGDSTVEARWVVSGLATGNYQVFAVWPGGAGYATNATYRVFDGTTYVGKMVVDQSTPSLPDVSANSAFQAIGTFYTSSGTLTFVLTDDANGKVVADTLRIIPVDPTVALKVKAYSVVGHANAGSWSGVLTDASTWGGTYLQTASSAATWDVPLRGLRPGNYLVEFAYSSGGGFGTAAPVTVTVDGVAMTAVTFNQQQPASGGTHLDGSTSVPFSPVGYYTTNGRGFVARLTGSSGATVNLSAFAFTRISFADLAASVSGTVTYSESLSIKVNGGDPVSLLSALWAVDLPRPYVTFFLSSAIAPGDTVTLSGPAGAIQTVAGSVAAVTDFAVENYAGGSALAPFEPSATRTLKMGWNVFSPAYSDVAPMYCDLMKGTDPLVSIGSPAATFNAKGELLTGSAWIANFSGCTNNPVNPYGYDNLPTGVYTLKWKGAGTPIFGGDNVTPLTDPVTVGQVSTRTYTVTTQVAAPDTISIILAMTGEVTDLHVYPPGVPTDGSQVFHPTYLEKLTNAAALRSMVWFHPDSSIIDYTDFSKSTDVSYLARVTGPRFTITRFDPYTDAEHYVHPTYLGILVTVDRPHGLTSGCTAIFGSPMFVNVTGPSAPAIDFSNYTICIYYNAGTMNTNQFLVPLQASGVVLPTLNPGTCSFLRGNGGPPEEYIDLCNLVGADAWVNTVDCMKDACVTELFTMVANRLTPGKKCYVELMNEPWNYYFAGFHYFYNLGYSRGIGMPEAYAADAAHHHALARAAFTAAGRSSGDIVGVYNVFINGAGGMADPLIQYCTAHSLPIDALALSPYYQVGPLNSSGFDAVCNALTTDQILDLAEYQSALMPASEDTVNLAHRALLDSYGYTSTRLVAYEMGPTDARLGGTDLNQAYHTQGVHKHPRFLEILLDNYRRLQTFGYDLACLYVIMLAYTPEGTPHGTKMYGAYTGWNQPAGKGDGSDGKADNRIDPWRTSTKVSVVGQSVLDWNAGPSSPPAPHVSHSLRRWATRRHRVGN